MPFNYYNWTNASNLGAAFVEAPNYHTGDWFWTAILYFLWTVALISFSFYSFEVGLLTASFFAMIVGIFMLYLHAIAWYWLVPFPAIIVFTILYIVWGKN